MSRTHRLVSIGRKLLWGGLALSVTASAGIVQGTVTGVAVGVTLVVLQGTTQIAEIVVPPGYGYSLALDPGAYVVVCPSGKRPGIRALNGPVVQDISC